MNNTPMYNTDKLLVAMELSNSKWLLAFHNGEKNRRKSIDARDCNRFVAELALAKSKMRFSEDAEVLCCYEAGRDQASRRVGIAALARKLLVALWKFVEFGEIPEGAVVV